MIDAKASPPRQSLPPEPSITGPNGSFGGLADNKLSIIDRYLKTMEAGNAKVSFSTDVGASYCTIIHVAAPSSEQIASARALLKNMVTQLRDGGHETIEFEQNAEKMLNSYLLYAGKFKVLTMCVGKGIGNINFFERYVDSEQEGLLSDGKYVPMPSDRKLLRYSSKWSPGDWAYDRYRDLIDYDASHVPSSGK